MDTYDYNSNNEINTMIISTKRKIQWYFNSYLDRELEKINLEASIVFPEVESLILGEYKKIAYNIFHETFRKRYNGNYDPKSLNNSLAFNIDNNLCPSVQYSKKDFTTFADYEKDKRSFNQNVRIEGGYDRLLTLDELDLVEEIEQENMETMYNSPYDYAEEEITLLNNVEPFQNKQLMLDPTEVYKEAEAQTNKQFLIAYESCIRPQISNILNKYRRK